jgi:hypothetical protein
VTLYDLNNGDAASTITANGDRFEQLAYGPDGSRDQIGYTSTCTTTTTYVLDVIDPGDPSHAVRIALPAYGYVTTDRTAWCR